MISVLAHPAGQPKGTANNILETRGFVASLVSETASEAMNITFIDVPQRRMNWSWQS
jgi:flavin reductase (DIM6/NTAB) family NADH-FMN oxidoreductase RutF